MNFEMCMSATISVFGKLDFMQMSTTNKTRNKNFNKNYTRKKKERKVLHCIVVEKNKKLFIPATFLFQQHEKKNLEILV